MSGVNIIAGSLTTTSALNITGNMGIGGNASIGGTTTITGNLNAANIQFVGGGGGTAGVTSITAGGVANLSGVVQFVAGTNLSIGGSLPGTVTVDLSGIGNPMPTDLDMSGWSLYSSTTSNVTVSGTLVTSSICASTPNMNICTEFLYLSADYIYQDNSQNSNIQTSLYGGQQLKFVNPSNQANGAGILMTPSGQLNIYQGGQGGSAGQITFTTANGTAITISEDNTVDIASLRVAGQPVVTGNVVTSISAGGVTNLSGVVQFLSLTNTVTISAGTGNQLYFDVSTSNVLSDWASVPASSNVDMNGKSLYTNTGNVTVSGNTNIYPNVNTSVIGPTTICPSASSYSIPVSAQSAAGYDRALVQMWGGAGGPAQWFPYGNNQVFGGAGGYLEFTISTAGITNFNASVGGAGGSGFATSVGSNTSGGYNYGGMGGSTGYSNGPFGWAGGGGGGATTFLIDNSLVAIAGGGGGAGSRAALWFGYIGGGVGGSSNAQNGFTVFAAGVGGTVGSNGGAGGAGVGGGSNGNSGGNGAPIPIGVSFGGSGGNGTTSYVGGGGGGAGWGGGGGGGTFFSTGTGFGGGAAGGGTSYLNTTSYGVVLVSNASGLYYNPAVADSDAPNAGSGIATNAATAYDGAIIVTFYSSTAGGLQTTALTVSGSVQATEYVTSTQLTPVLNNTGYTSPLFTPSSAGASVGYYVATSYSLTPGNQLVVAPFAVTYDGSMVPSTGNIATTVGTNLGFFYNVSGNTLVLGNGTGTNFSNIYTRITKLG